jgi:hypothetical protein
VVATDVRAVAHELVVHTSTLARLTARTQGKARRQEDPPAER